MACYKFGLIIKISKASCLCEFFIYNDGHLVKSRQMGNFAIYGRSTRGSDVWGLPTLLIALTDN